MTSFTRPVTAEQVRQMGDIGRCEIIYGELIMMSPAGAEHGAVALRIGRYVGDFVDEHNVGETLAAETGFLLERDPDLLRAPDVAVVRRERIGERLPRQFFAGAPDIAVEVVSPDESRRAVQEKVNMWLAHGTRSVWVADPEEMTITLYRTGQPARRFAAGDDFVDPGGLPGFSMPVNKVFLLP